MATLFVRYGSIAPFRQLGSPYILQHSAEAIIRLMRQIQILHNMGGGLRVQLYHICPLILAVLFNGKASEKTEH